ncbi:hypothetical protein AVEN_66517-1 [Araneus ventricosus]|uniref:RNase H type-1 domain-containing protein n=1 Tax=Araneus ventricosus TaxID=182803 RepID=A0A4Y2EDY8_ARAVE|nr:hypothetical protein AVEN_66517-1 [Araneus ventricosus]
MGYPRALQISVDNSRTAHSSAFVTAGDLNIDFLCIQDPYLFEGKALGGSSDYDIKISKIPIDNKIIELPASINNPDFDGSGIDGIVGTAEYIFEKNNLIKHFGFKLSQYNSVFQAELATINFAAAWALEKGVKINIFTDSFSSIKALKKSKCNSNYISQVKRNMLIAIGSVGLSWMKAHADNPGNELADQHAKLATKVGENLDIPTPYSFLKSRLKHFA